MKKPYSEGKMIKIICEKCLVWNLDDAANISSLLKAVCRSINMTPLGGPYLAEVKGDTEEDNGISGVLIVAESHIAIHCWNYHRSVRVVIDSCKDFDEAIVIELLINTLLPLWGSVADEVWR